MAKRGETREVILKAATKVFFENGYEATSVKMLISEAGIVIGSFYHFFESKEALFEGVVERFIDEYTAGISEILQDESLSFNDMIDMYVKQFVKANKTYYEMLHGDKLHWSLQYALHDRILDTVIKMFTDMLTNRIDIGEVVKLDNISESSLALFIVKGIDTLLSETDDNNKLVKYCEKYISVNTNVKRAATRKVSVNADAQNTKEVDANKEDKKDKENKKDNKKQVVKETAKESNKAKPKNNNKTKDSNKESKSVKTKPAKKAKKIEEETYVQMSIFEFQ